MLRVRFPCIRVHFRFSSCGELRVDLAVIGGGRQFGAAADQFGHRVDFGVGQRRDETFGRLAGDRCKSALA